MIAVSLAKARAFARPVLLLLLAGWLGTACAPGAGSPGADVAAAPVARTESSDAGPGPPRLVLVLAIDQLRRDRLTRELPGGLGRLAREGRSFEDAAMEHAFTNTCPGHVTMLTGRHPGAAGVPGNHFIDRETLEKTYCVADDSGDARVLGREDAKKKLRDAGRSPRNVRVTALGDWLKAQRPAARVFSVSAKDRAAIPLGGQRPDGAYWLDRKVGPRFTTSAYYEERLPEWVETWGYDKIFADVPDLWRYKVSSITPAKAIGREDEYEVEDGRFGLASPHPITRGPGNRGRSKKELRLLSASRLYVSPYLDQVTLAFARDLVEREGLGQGESTDLLALSLSATDTVGHSYGPDSWEALDALMRLDGMLEEFLAFLASRVSPGGLVVVLTADHGVMPIPEWLLERGRSRCQIPYGRGDPGELLALLAAALDERFGSVGAARHPWFSRAEARLTLHPARALAEGVEAGAVLAAAEELLEGQRGVTAVWSLPEALATRGESAMASYYANGWDPERAGDLAIQFDVDCLYDGSQRGTSHGSPYEYDRAVPLVFFGGGIAAGSVPGRAAPVDIAPTLADLLGLEPPAELDGRVLPLH